MISKEKKEKKACLPAKSLRDRSASPRHCETKRHETETRPRPKTVEAVTRPRPQKSGLEAGLETKTGLENYKSIIRHTRSQRIGTAAV